MESIADSLQSVRDDPDAFNRAFLNRPPYWSRQVELCRSIVEYRTTVAYSGNMVGKDYWIAGIIIWWLLTRPDSLCILTGPSQTVLGSVTFKEIRRCLEGAVLPFGGKVSSGIKASPAKVEVMPGWHCLGFSTTSVERRSGQHAKHLLAVVEEASGVEDFVFDAIDSLGYERLVCIGNPLHSQGRFVDLIHQAARDRADNVPPRLAVNAIQIPSTESPDADKERSEFGLADRTWLESMYRKYGRRSLWVGSHIDARIPTSTPNSSSHRDGSTGTAARHGRSSPRDIRSSRPAASPVISPKGLGEIHRASWSGTIGGCSRWTWATAWDFPRPRRQSAGWPGSGKSTMAESATTSWGSAATSRITWPGTASRRPSPTLARAGHKTGPLSPTYERSAAGSFTTGSTRRTWNTS